MARTGQAGLIALIAALALSHPALAQDSVTDFRLPPAPTPSASSSVQGPADPENPFGNRATPRATATPAPAPSPQPSITLPPASPTPEPRASRSEAAEPGPTQPRPRANESAAPARSASSNRTEAASAAPATAGPTQAPAPGTDVPAAEPISPTPEAVAPAIPVAAQGETGQSSNTWLIALMVATLALVAAAAVWFLAKRRRAPVDARETLREETPFPTPAPQPSAPAALAPTRPVGIPPRAATPVRSHSPADAPRGVSLAIEPVSLRVSLAYATLIFRATILNNSDAASGPLAIRGDLASAHRAVDQRATLSPALSDLDPLAMVQSLAPGTAQEQRLEVKLPLNHIAGFRKGGHQFFVPLARLALVPEQGEANVRVWTIGTSGSERLGPICADTPRLFTELGAIEIETERWLALDPVRAAS